MTEFFMSCPDEPLLPLPPSDHEPRCTLPNAISDLGILWGLALPLPILCRVERSSGAEEALEWTGGPVCRRGWGGGC